MEENDDFEGLDWNATDFNEDTRFLEFNYEQNLTDFVIIPQFELFSHNSYLMADRNKRKLHPEMKAKIGIKQPICTLLPEVKIEK